MRQLTRAPVPHLRPFVRQVWAWAPGAESAGAERPGAREHVPVSYTHLTLPTKA